MKKFILLLACGAFLHASVAKISAIRGEASIIRDGQSIPAALNLALENRDTIKTSAKARLQIIFDDATVATIGKNTEFKISEFRLAGKDSAMKLEVPAGSFKLISGEISKIARENFALRANTATIGIRGTVFVGEITPKMSQIACLNGAIAINHGKLVREVKAGKQISYTPKKLNAIKPVQLADFSMARANFAADESESGGSASGSGASSGDSTSGSAGGGASAVAPVSEQASNSANESAASDLGANASAKASQAAEKLGKKAADEVAKTTADKKLEDATAEAKPAPEPKPEPEKPVTPEPEKPVTPEKPTVQPEKPAPEKPSTPVTPPVEKPTKPQIELPEISDMSSSSQTVQYFDNDKIIGYYDGENVAFAAILDDKELLNVFKKGDKYEVQRLNLDTGELTSTKVEADDVTVSAEEGKLHIEISSIAKFESEGSIEESVYKDNMKALLDDEEEFNAQTTYDKKKYIHKADERRKFVYRNSGDKQEISFTPKTGEATFTHLDDNSQFDEKNQYSFVANKDEMSIRKYDADEQKYSKRIYTPSANNANAKYQVFYDKTDTYRPFRMTLGDNYVSGNDPANKHTSNYEIVADKEKAKITITVGTNTVFRTPQIDPIDRVSGEAIDDKLIGSFDEKYLSKDTLKDKSGEKFYFSNSSDKAIKIEVGRNLVEMYAPATLTEKSNSQNGNAHVIYEDGQRFADKFKGEFKDKDGNVLKELKDKSFKSTRSSKSQIENDVLKLNENITAKGKNFKVEFTFEHDNGASADVEFGEDKTKVSSKFEKLQSSTKDAFNTVAENYNKGSQTSAPAKDTAVKQD